MPEALLLSASVLTVFGVAGLFLGRLAGTLIKRLPLREPLRSPAVCRACGASRAWRDRIPVVSWLASGGVCRSCKARIPVSEPLLELNCALVFVAAAIFWGPTLRAAAGALFVYLLLVLSIVDYRCRRLPNVLVGPLAAIGLAGAVISQLTGIRGVPLVDAGIFNLFSMPLLEAITGAVVGTLVTLTIAAVYSRIRGVKGLGMGDVKLLGAMGFFLGPYTLFAYALATVIGAVVGLALVFNRRGVALSNLHMPFGPMLAVAGVLTAVAGPQMWAWAAPILW